MILNAAQRDQITYRRELVAQFRAKGMFTREIAKALQPHGIHVTHVTIAADVKVIKKQWLESAGAAMGDHIARELAEIEEAKREARQKGSLDTWAKLMALEMKLLGTDAPQKFEDWTGNNWREYVKQRGYDPDALMHEAEEIVSKRFAELGVPGGDSGSDREETGRAAVAIDTSQSEDAA